MVGFVLSHTLNFYDTNLMLTRTFTERITGTQPILLFKPNPDAHRSCFSHFSFLRHRGTFFFGISFPIQSWKYLNFWKNRFDVLTNRFQINQRHQPTHLKAFAPITTGIRLHNARHLPSNFTHSKAFAHQDPPWHGSFNFLLYDHTKIESSGFSFSPAQNIVPTSPWPQHECHSSPTTRQVS